MNRRILEELTLAELIQKRLESERAIATRQAYDILRDAYLAVQDEIRDYGLTTERMDALNTLMSAGVHISASSK